MIAASPRIKDEPPTGFSQEIGLDKPSLELTNRTVVELQRALVEIKAGGDANYDYGCYCFYDGYIKNIKCCCVWSNWCI